MRLCCMYRTGPPSLVPSPSPLTASVVSTLGNQDVPQLVSEFPSLINHSKNLTLGMLMPKPLMILSAKIGSRIFRGSEEGQRAPSQTFCLLSE